MCGFAPERENKAKINTCNAASTWNQGTGRTVKLWLSSSMKPIICESVWIGNLIKVKRRHSVSVWCPDVFCSVNSAWRSWTYSWLESNLMARVTFCSHFYFSQGHCVLLFHSEVGGRIGLLGGVKKEHVVQVDLPVDVYWKSCRLQSNITWAKSSNFLRTKKWLSKVKFE